MKSTIFYESLERSLIWIYLVPTDSLQRAKHLLIIISLPPPWSSFLFFRLALSVGVLGVFTKVEIKKRRKKIEDDVLLSSAIRVFLVERIKKKFKSRRALKIKFSFSAICFSMWLASLPPSFRRPQNSTSPSQPAAGAAAPQPVPSGRDDERAANQISSSTHIAQPVYTSDRCAICLRDPPQNAAFLDPCFHSFCYDCMMSVVSIRVAQVSVHVREGEQDDRCVRCPICRSACKSLVHNIRGDSVFDTMRLDHILASESLQQSQHVPSCPLPIVDRVEGIASRRWAKVYGLGRPSNFLPSAREEGGLFSSNSQIFGGVDRLSPWIQRELTFLLCGCRDLEECVELVCDVVLRVVIRQGRTREEAIADLGSWLPVQTAALFLHELNCFAATRHSTDTYEEILTRAEEQIAAEDENEELEE